MSIRAIADDEGGAYGPSFATKAVLFPDMLWHVLLAGDAVRLDIR